MVGFEELEVWNDSMRLAQKVYDAFDSCRDFGLRDQICHAAVSIPSNIAEGYEHGSNKVFVRFLKIATQRRETKNTATPGAEAFQSGC